MPNKAQWRWWSRGDDAVKPISNRTGEVATNRKFVTESIGDQPHISHGLLTALALAVAFAIAWPCEYLTATAARKDELLRATSYLNFQPEKFQGAGKKERYIEGWYHKLVGPLGGAVGVVPGIFYGDSIDSNESHAFVFVALGGERQHYYRFDTSEFSYASADASDEYYIQVGSNRFTSSGLSLDLRPREGDDASLVLRGEVAFSNPSPWPISLTHLGVMGPGGWLPGVNCKHAILSFNHDLRGSLTMTEEREGGNESLPSSSLSFDGGHGYTEKSYGDFFPSAWIWAQSNSFKRNPGTSLFLIIREVPLFGTKLPGMAAALWHNSTLTPFATWNGARIEDLRVSDEEVFVAVRSNPLPILPAHRIELTFDRRDVPEVLVYGPVNLTKMAPLIPEALQALVHVRLIDTSGEIVFDDVGEHAGLEVHGNLQWLVDSLCGKKTVNKILCL